MVSGRKETASNETKGTDMTNGATTIHPVHAKAIKALKGKPSRVKVEYGHPDAFNSQPYYKVDTHSNEAFRSIVKNLTGELNVHLDNTGLLISVTKKALLETAKYMEIMPEGGTRVTFKIQEDDTFIYFEQDF